MRRGRRLPLLLLSVLIHALVTGAIGWAQRGTRAVERGTAAVAPDIAPRTGEILVNSFTANHQRNPDVAAHADGGFVVVWENRPGADPFEYDVIARRFTSVGSPLGSELVINAFTTGLQNDPHVAAGAAGDFVVVWWSPQGIGLSAKVMARRFDSAGGAAGGEIQINVHTTLNSDSPDIAMGADGRFLVVWDSFPVDGSQEGVVARLFDSSGAPLGIEQQLNIYTLDHQIDPAVAVDGSGRFVVVWRSDGQDGSFDGVFGRRLDSSGSPIASEFQINTVTVGVQSAPSVASAENGTFLVSWSSTQGTSPNEIFARRYTSTGIPLAVEFLVNTYTSSNQYLSAVAALETGDFVLTWTSYQDGDGFGIFARRNSLFGAAQGTELQVNVHTPGSQNHSAIAGDGAGGFVVAWDSNGQDGDQYGVIARRYVTLALLDIDGDDTLGTATDGVLIARFLFGFTGSALIDGAIGGGCSRCTIGPVATYLQSFGAVLDVDGNGSIRALTDGLLVMRYMAGFSGAALTTGAVGTSCARCDAASIVAYLDGIS